MKVLRPRDRAYVVQPIEVNGKLVFQKGEQIVILKSVDDRLETESALTEESGLR